MMPHPYRKDPPTASAVEAAVEAAVLTTPLPLPPRPESGKAVSGKTVPAHSLAVPLSPNTDKNLPYFSPKYSLPYFQKPTQHELKEHPLLDKKQSKSILINNTLPIRYSLMQSSKLTSKGQVTLLQGNKITVDPIAIEITSLFGLIKSDKTASLKEMQEAIEKAASKTRNF